MRQKVVELLDLQEAMNNLATVASIDMESPPPLGIVEGRRFVIDTEEFGGAKVQWLSGEGAEEIWSLLDRSYRSILLHLQTLYGSSEMDWDDQKNKEGIASMMALVGESAGKIDQYLAYRLDVVGEKVEEREDFRALQKFYSERFAKKFAGGVEGAEAWREEWQKKKASSGRVGQELIDFEEIVKDLDYELFFLKNEKGAPYFDRKKLQNVKLTAEFDVNATPFEEDPFLKVRTMLDRDLNATAQQILKTCAHELQEFYGSFRKMKKTDLTRDLSQSVMALFLASNPRHLMSSTSGKNATAYFHDFYYFLRLALKSEIYQKWMVYPPEQESLEFNILIPLIHKICLALFDRSGGIKQEAIGLIHRTARRGGEIQNHKLRAMKADTEWSEFLLEDEKLRSWLSKFSSGPLLKTLERIRENEMEEQVPFDPLFQGNLPVHLFDMQKGKKKIRVFRMPCPTRQFRIDRAEIVDEFKGFIRFVAGLSQNQKHLAIHFQNRLSWKESARSLAFEEIQKSPKFASHLFVMTLPKDTDFYHQNKEFEGVNSADSFFKSFKEVLGHPEENGFYFPPQWKREIVLNFAKDTLPLIHRYVFDNKSILTRQERQNCIECFYQMLILKAIEISSPNSLSFSCKDGVDTSAAASSAFYGFIQLLQGGMKTKEEADFLRYLFYFSALFIRERPIDVERMHAALSLLEAVDVAVTDFGSELKKALSIEWEIR